MNFYKNFWKFAKHVDPEKIHHLTLDVLNFFPQIANFFPKLSIQSTQGFHIQWRAPIGIAAGLDKNAQCLDFWNNLGIGCIEVGTVTPLGQYGNKKPRIVRIGQNGLINSLGFPSQGAKLVYKKVFAFKEKHANNCDRSKIWINIGKQSDTPLHQALDDYKNLISQFSNLADVITVNISSPNTKDLRSLQNSDMLPEFLKELSLHRNQQKIKPPLFLKISPDEENSFYQNLPALLKKHNWQGVIATNTTRQHNLTIGGLSGPQLFPRSFEIAKYLSSECKKNEIDYVFAGGLSSHDQYIKLKDMGVNFFQLYTALVYQGPSVFKNIIS